MCGIVGYVGQDNAGDFLLSGLRRLEYRGYDSAGVAIHGQGAFHITRSVGRIDALVQSLGAEPIDGPTGIGHTRWATHGPATEDNAHPHLGGDGEVILVHNGVIENFQTLKNELIEKGYQFQSATDSEVIAHLVAEGLKVTSETEDDPRKAEQILESPRKYKKIRENPIKSILKKQKSRKSRELENQK